MRMFIRASVVLLGWLPLLAFADSRPFPIPDELRSDRFTMTLDGQAAGVAHAATTYHFVNFEFRGPTVVSLSGPSDDYWSAGVEVQPWRWGIRPRIQGRTITFTLNEPGKFSISRPGDHGATAEMLFLFANLPEMDAPPPDAPNVHYLGPGVHRESIDARTGDRLYLAPGALLFGSINVWGVNDVHIWGRGTVVYDGPQNPNADEGWMHKPNWHAIVMDHARNIHISGITLVVRSRTWMIQLLSSRDLLFENIKVIGGCPGNANQDGMDWLGGGDTVVRDCFFRASDDIFALYGNWLGYSEEALRTPGEDVTNILVEKCVLSTSISNIVRVSWPKKVFNSHNFRLQDSDVIHMGQGGCKIPFALLTIWSDPDGHGEHTDYVLQDLRLENWYSLLQLYQAKPAIRRVSLERIWALGTPSLVPDAQVGDVRDIMRSDVYVDGRLGRAFTYSAGPLRPGQPVHFHSSIDAVSYHWIFGDGTTAEGKDVDHRFPDEEGTLRDGSGRFRVILQTRNREGVVHWETRSVVVASRYGPARGGTLMVPQTGGYTFHLIANDPAQVSVDGQLLLKSPPPKPQVCGSVGNMVQVVVKTRGLTAGSHSVAVQRTHGAGPDHFALWWEGPGVPLTKVETVE
jgi:PA14 domain